MDDITIAPLKNAPRAGLIDEIVADGVRHVHIEQMSPDCFWMQIDQRVFHFRAISTVKQRPVAIDLTEG